MICCIFGSRSIRDYKLLKEVIKASGFSITKVISGGANGVDTMAMRYAIDHQIPFEEFKADWSIGRHAGMIRNEKMLMASECAIGVHDGRSSGTAHSVECCKTLALPLYLRTLKSTLK